MAGITTAKTSLPRAAAAVVRRRLFRELDRARRQPITWVVGPPGSGKTTLVASYIAARRVSRVWYHVDAGDADVATSFHYLSAAAPRRRRALPHLTPEYSARLSTFAQRFFRELYGRLKPPFVLALDNYELFRGDVAALERALAGGRLVFQRGRIGGVWPELKPDPLDTTHTS